MAKTGPKPKPTALKKLQGNPGKRSLPGREPAPPGKTKKPYGLGAYNPEVAKLWDRYAPPLMAVGMLTPSDEPAFLFMLQHIQFAREAAGTVRREGMTRRDEQNIERKNPNLQIWRDNSAAALKYMNHFGMTPSDRVGMTTPDDDMPTLAQELFRLANGG